MEQTENQTPSVDTETPEVKNNVKANVMALFRQLTLKQALTGVVVIVGLQVLLTVDAVLNAIPLLDKPFELVGLYVVAKFAFKRLLRKSDREKFLVEFKSEVKEYL